MRNIIFFSIALPYILECESRLLVKTTERAFVSKNDDFKTVSITKHCLHGKHRRIRSAEEVSVKEEVAHVKRSIEKGKIPLVKKPIPTYVEVNYDEDYQSRMVRWPEKYTDSSENEDEDFNLDDYEFDVNHDEYAGRGKPSEPRVKSHKNLHSKSIKLEEKSVPVEIKVLREGNQQNKTNFKRQETVDNYKGRGDDYYDDITTKFSEPKIVYAQQDFGEETYDGNKYGRKGSVRMIRSPWDLGVYANKLEEKDSVLVNKVLSILPMFPQIPQKKTE